MATSKKTDKTKAAKKTAKTTQGTAKKPGESVKKAKTTKKEAAKTTQETAKAPQGTAKAPQGTAKTPEAPVKKAKTTRKKAATKASMLKIEYYRSAIGLDGKQKSIVKGLGFRRLNAVRELEDSREIRGMVAKIPHLVRIVQD